MILHHRNPRNVPQRFGRQLQPVLTRNLRPPQLTQLLERNHRHTRHQADVLTRMAHPILLQRLAQRGGPGVAKQPVMFRAGAHFQPGTQNSSVPIAKHRFNRRFTFGGHLVNIAHHLITHRRIQRRYGLPKWHIDNVRPPRPANRRQCKNGRVSPVTRLIRFGQKAADGQRRR